MPFTQIADARIYWKLEGSDGPNPLVLLNSIGTDMDVWDPVLPMLRAHGPVLRIDTRGHGASTGEPGDYTLAMLADDVFAVMRDAGIGAATIAGVSLGGMIGMQMALTDPTRVKALVLVCTSATMDRNAWNQRVETVREKGMAAIADMAVERFLSPAYIAAQPWTAQTLRRQLLAMNACGYAGCGAAIRDMDLIGNLGRIDCPTLVVTGERDISTPLVGHGEHLLHGISGSRHVALDAAHLAPIEAPDQLAQAMRVFIGG